MASAIAEMLWSKDVASEILWDSNQAQVSNGMYTRTFCCTKYLYVYENMCKYEQDMKSYMCI